MSTVVLNQYLFRGDAEIARAALDSAGIAAIVKAEDEGGLNPGFYSEFRVALLVNESDARDARQVLGLDQPMVIPGQVRDAMLAHANWALPNEACGLLAGTATEVALVFCLSNRLASPTRYTIDPREHFGAARLSENWGLSILGAWHSHPNGDAAISQTDVAESPGGEWLTVIVGNYAKPGEVVRAYRTEAGSAVELEVVIVSTS